MRSMLVVGPCIVSAAPPYTPSPERRRSLQCARIIHNSQHVKNENVRACTASNDLITPQRGANISELSSQLYFRGGEVSKKLEYLSLRTVIRVTIREAATRSRRSLLRDAGRQLHGHARCAGAYPQTDSCELNVGGGAFTDVAVNGIAVAIAKAQLRACSVMKRLGARRSRWPAAVGPDAR